MMNTNSNEHLSRAESSRINGAKSRGPVTPEGRQRSSWNRTTHGMHSARVVLRNECLQTYNDLSQRFTLLFQPRDIFEQELVSNLINARWRIRRLEAASAANLDLAIEEARPEFSQRYQNLAATHEHALAYRAIALASGNSDLMGRHEDRQHRIFERSYRLLAKHRGRNAALPSNEEMLRAEADLPSDNLPPPEPDLNLLQTEPDAFNQGIEPEPAKPLVVTTPAKPKSSKKEKPEEPRHPMCVYEDEYKILKPIMDALEPHPELKLRIAQTIREYIASQENTIAA